MASKICDTLLAAVASGALLLSGAQLASARGGGFGGGHFGGGGFGGGHFGGGGFGGGHFGGGGIAGGHFGGVHFGGGAARFGGAAPQFGGVRSFGLAHSHFGAIGQAHFGAASHGHFGNAHVRGLGGNHLGSSLISHGNLGHATAHNFNGGRLGAHSNFAHGSAAHAFAAAGSGAFAGKAAWNRWGNPNWQHGWNGGWNGWNGRWGGWYAGWGGWVGPVFWPYFFGDLLAFAFWPYAYFDPFWAYGDWFVWDALFWPGPYDYYGPAYVYGPDYYDVYGQYAYDGRRTRTAYHSHREVIGSVSSQTDLAQSCGGLAPGVTELPLEGIETTLHLTADQLKNLDELKAASSQASDLLKTTCSNEVPLTPVDRLDAVQKRIDSMTNALAIVRAPFDNFYNSLNDEQRQRFAASSAQAEQRRLPASNKNLATLCSQRAESFTQLPAQRVEQIVKPTQQQLDSFEKLKSVSIEAANQLHASCPTQPPQTPIDRLDAISKRLDSMSAAIKTVRPALADFYASLSDEQKARFNTLGPPNAARRS